MDEKAFLSVGEKQPRPLRSLGPFLWALPAKLINCRSQVRPRAACGGRLGPSDSQLRFYPVGFCNIGLLCFLTSIHYCYFSDSIVSFAM